ncbi:MAG: Abortive infection protein [Anaerocolumna sp.]|jgi:membrane protease YdiL (CAAX protease family)|nr:Abortive infection protein [Anaerocolumna sp.]
MINKNNKQYILVSAAPILCIAMLIFMPFLTIQIGKTTGYIAGFCIYWFIFCLPISLYCSNGFGKLREIYTQKSNITAVIRNIYYLLAFMPCIAIFFVVFKKVAPIAGFQVLVIALVFAIINGTFEELFWRGIFNKIFNNNIFLAYIYPSLFFGIWHIALYLAKGIIYQGGFASLVGGSFFMGLLWGWVAYKTKSIKVVTAVHIITNFFAFTGLIYQNWFR